MRDVGTRQAWHLFPTARPMLHLLLPLWQRKGECWEVSDSIPLTSDSLDCLLCLRCSCFQHCRTPCIFPPWLTVSCHHAQLTASLLSTIDCHLSVFCVAGTDRRLHLPAQCYPWRDRQSIWGCTLLHQLHALCSAVCAAAVDVPCAAVADVQRRRPLCCASLSPFAFPLCVRVQVPLGARTCHRRRTPRHSVEWPTEETTHCDIHRPRVVTGRGPVEPQSDHTAFTFPGIARSRL